MLALASLNAPPPEKVLAERSMRVEALRVVYEDIQTNIKGYGPVKALNSVSIAPEVSGVVVYVHPSLEVGETVKAGEVMFSIDARDYQAVYREALASAERLENVIKRLEREYVFTQNRTKTLERNKALARAELVRFQKLFENNVKAVSRSGVDKAERDYNSVVEETNRLAQEVDVYPLKIKEMESELALAEAGLAVAKCNLDRCVVRAPFTGRIKEVSLEQRQYVASGRSVVNLADDSILEIQIPLDSRDAGQWLQFDKPVDGGNKEWFENLVLTPCRVRWVEDAGHNHFYQGRVHRVVKFDDQTRTLVVAVRLTPRQAMRAGWLPLVEGMFCEVTIPGRRIENAVRLPGPAVNFEQTAYISDHGRLATVPVTVARMEGDQVYIASGLKPGDLVITTRLVDPLENMLLDLRECGPTQAARDGSDP